MTPVRLSRGAVDLWVNPDAVERWHGYVDDSGLNQSSVVFRSGGIIQVNETPDQLAEIFRDPEAV